jgi:hypothetical protein
VVEVVDLEATQQVLLVLAAAVLAAWQLLAQAVLQTLVAVEAVAPATEVRAVRVL